MYLTLAEMTAQKGEVMGNIGGEVVRRLLFYSLGTAAAVFQDAGAVLGLAAVR